MATSELRNTGELTAAVTFKFRLESSVGGSELRSQWASMKHSCGSITEICVLFRGQYRVSTPLVCLRSLAPQRPTFCWNQTKNTLLISCANLCCVDVDWQPQLLRVVSRSGSYHEISNDQDDLVTKCKDTRQVLCLNLQVYFTSSQLGSWFPTELKSSSFLVELVYNTIDK